MIAEVIEAFGGREAVRSCPRALRQLRVALRQRFPDGEVHHPYKIWLDEIRVQLGEKPPPGSRKPVKPCEGQLELFEEE